MSEFDVAEWLVDVEKRAALAETVTFPGDRVRSLCVYVRTLRARSGRRDIVQNWLIAAIAGIAFAAGFLFCAELDQRDQLRDIQAVCADVRNGIGQQL